MVAISGTAAAGIAGASALGGLAAGSTGGGLVDASSRESEYSPTYSPKSTEVDARQSSQQFSLQEGDFNPSVIISSPDASTETTTKKTARQTQTPTQETTASPNQEDTQDRSEGIGTGTILTGVGIAAAAYVAAQVL